MLEYIILGMLMQKEMTGYDLKQWMVECTSYFFDESFGSIYPALKRMEQKGYIIYRESVEDGKFKKLYSISDLGKEYFFSWLEQPIEFVNANHNYLVSGCRGCNACMQVQDSSGCVLQDDMYDVYSKIISADAFIIASAIYCYELASQIKPLLDRSFALMYTPLLNEKTVADLITCMGEENGNANPVTKAFHRMFDSSQKSIFQTKLAGAYVVPYSRAEDFESRATCQYGL